VLVLVDSGIILIFYEAEQFFNARGWDLIEYTHSSITASALRRHNSSK
jgi:hypothetical protein